MPDELKIRCPHCGAMNDLPADDRPLLRCSECWLLIDVVAELAELPEDRRLRERGEPTLPGLPLQGPVGETE